MGGRGLARAVAQALSPLAMQSCARTPGAQPLQEAALLPQGEESSLVSGESCAVQQDFVPFHGGAGRGAGPAQAPAFPPAAGMQTGSRDSDGGGKIQRWEKLAGDFGEPCGEMHSRDFAELAP